MIGFHWSSDTSGVCPNCGQGITAKRKYLRLFGLPIPLGSPSVSCGCTGGQQPMAQGYPGQQPMAQGYPGQQPMAQGYPGQQPMAQGYPAEQQQMSQQAAQQQAAPQQQAQHYPCQQCQTPLQWVAEYQRWYCPTCQQYV